MVRKKLATAVLVFSTLQAGLASALGLGELSLNSTLNQPLDAEIRLLDTGELDPSQVVVRLASGEDFERAGVERDFFLTNLRFEVELNERGGGVIHITTREPVIEPYLNFLLETRWPNGRLLREYTALMDLPSSAARDETPRPAESRQAAPAPAATPTQSQARSQTRSQTQRSASTRMPEAGARDEYRVQHNDTLSQIARRFQPADASVQQTMLAIQRANPEAFINGNINLVKSGYVLRLPDTEQVQALDVETAAAEVAEQNRAWRSGRNAETDTGPQLDAREGERQGGASGGGEGRLSIATAGDSERGAAGEGTGGGAGDSAALREELAATQENLDRAERDKEELRSRLGDMERQIATLQRLIELKDDQLAALQARLEADEGAGDGDEEGAPGGADDVAQAAADSAEGGSEAGGADSAKEGDAGEDPVDFNYAGAPAAADGAPDADPDPTTPPPDSAPGLLERVTANPLYPAAAVGALLLVLLAVWALRRRSQEQETETESAFAEEELAFEDDALQLDQDSFDEGLFAGELEEQEPETAPAATAAAGAAGAEEAPVSAGTRPVRSETGDAIAEADIYIAYGRYQQAADLLRSAIESEPERSDLRIKLLEVHVEARDKAAFQTEFVALEALGDETAVAQVKEHLSSVDGVADWLDDLPAAAGTAAFASQAAAMQTGSEVRDEERPGGDDAVIADADDERDQNDWEEDLGFDLELDTLESEGGSGLSLEDEFDSGDGARTTETELDLDDLDTGDRSARSELDDLDFALDRREEQDFREAEESFGEETTAADETDARPTAGSDADGGSDLELSLDGDDDEFDLALSDTDTSDSDEWSDLDLKEEGDSDESLTGEFDLSGEFAGDLSEDTAGGESDRAGLDLEAEGSDSGSLDTDAMNNGSLDLESDEFDSRPAGGTDLDLGDDRSEARADDLDLGAGGLDLEGRDSGVSDEGEWSLESGLENELELDSDSDLDKDLEKGAPGPSDLDEPGLDEGSLDESGLDADLQEDRTAGEQAGWDELDSGEGLAFESGFDDPGTETDAEPPRSEPDTADALSAEDVLEEDTAPAAPSEAGAEPATAVEDDEEFDFLGDADESATKLDLARAYIDMGDADGARDILNEVLEDGTDAQKQDAEALLARL